MVKNILERREQYFKHKKLTQPTLGTTLYYSLCDQRIQFTIFELST